MLSQPTQNSDKTETLLKTVNYLSDHFFCPTKDELHHFFLNHFISTDEYSNVLKSAIDNGVVEYSDSYVGNNSNQLSEAISKRIEHFKKLKLLLRSIEEDLKQSLDKDYVLLVGLFPSIESKVLVVVKKGTKNIAAARVNSLQKNWAKKSGNIKIELTDSIKEYVESRMHEIHTVCFEMLNLKVLANKEGLYERVVGHLLHNDNYFPNYPIANLPGVKFEKTLPDHNENSSVTKALDSLIGLWR